MDFFAGSGTTGVAAKLTNRNWIGFDLSKDYQIMAENRK
jgi:DNA modification methylase